MVKPVASVHITPSLPKPIERLEELAYNMRWAWDHETIDLFRRLDPELWETTYHNPVWMLGLVSQERLDNVTKDPAFMAHYERVLSAFDEYMNAENTWYNQHYQGDKHPIIAYFSMEFGITESLQNYSGGLGILSGDHVKSASDLGIPLVGVGLLYQEGYFQQYLNADGWQQESYPINDWANLPVELQRDADGKPIKISVPLPGRELYAVIWKVQVGRVPVFLLDTNIPDNPKPEDRDLTDRLYGGDRRTRIRQEILMGIGGIRALDALGLRPDVCHMNEGHSAFLLLERIRQLMHEKGLSFKEAQTIVKASTVFTLHTPVPAGLERFGFDLIDEHFTDYMREVGITREEFIDLGRENMGDYELFSMSVMALKLSSGANGVAKLHGEVSRNMWQWLFPNVPEHEIPIGSVTNGIHVQTWTSDEMGRLFDRYLNPAWRTEDWRDDVWSGIEEIPDEELWRTHVRRRERLVTFVRKRLRQQLERRGASPSQLEAAEEALNPEALTIGFARRFATYKRATLLFRDIERLRRILNDADRPVQIIFAGKAHPHDTEGKELIRQIVQLSQTEEFRHSLVFIENYDMNVARYMVQGVDVWLNNPRRPKEASGTSGMKVIYNGGLNCSILDGWWAEAYSPEVGWAIGNGEQYEEPEWEHQDYIESHALYNLLEHDIVPLFYHRDRNGLPREWIAKVKASLRTLAPYFSTHRMVQEYMNDYYWPTFERIYEMTVPDFEKALTFNAWQERIEAQWSQIKVKEVIVPAEEVPVGSELTVDAIVDLGALRPEDVRVQLYYGTLDRHAEIEQGEAIDMEPISMEDGLYTYRATIRCTTSGNQGVSVRVVPYHPYLHTSFQPGLITWA